MIGLLKYQKGYEFKCRGCGHHYATAARDVRTGDRFDSDLFDFTEHQYVAQEKAHCHKCGHDWGFDVCSPYRPLEVHLSSTHWWDFLPSAIARRLTIWSTKRAVGKAIDLDRKGL